MRKYKTLGWSMSSLEFRDNCRSLEEFGLNF